MSVEICLQNNGCGNFVDNLFAFISPHTAVDKHFFRDHRSKSFVLIVNLGVYKGFESLGKIVCFLHSVTLRTVHIERKSEYDYVDFELLDKLGSDKSLTVYFQKSATDLAIAADATKLVNLVEKLASISDKATLNTVASLLEKYDQICIGLRMKK